MDVVNTEQAEFWSDLAPTWVSLAAHLELVSGPPGRLAMDALAPRAGEHLLDVGCGAGSTTIELAARVAPGGSVLGVDIAEEMLASARQGAARAGAAGVEFRRADVQAEDLGEARFDGAFSRFGVMFFADPVAGFANVRRSLRPGGRLSFACWKSVFENEWMLVPGMAAMAVVGELPLPGPEEPGPFALADPDRVRSVLKAAGFSSVHVDSIDDTVDLEEPDIAKQAWVSSQVGAVRSALAEAGEDRRAEVVGAVEEALRQRLVDGVVRLARGVHIVSAQA